MSKLIWDPVGKRTYETGVEKGVLYPIQQGNTYNKGVAWNGLISVSENPSGGEPSPIYADNIKYLNLMSNEEFGGSIEAYTYPDEFMACDGSKALAEGVFAGQQSRQTFGLSYMTILGNDTELNDHGAKLHLVYGCLASPSEKQYQTVGDNPEAITFSWEFNTTPVEITTLVGGKKLKPTSILTIDSTKIAKDKFEKLIKIVHGSDEAEARLPLPDEVISIVTAG